MKINNFTKFFIIYFLLLIVFSYITLNINADIGIALLVGCLIFLFFGGITYGVISAFSGNASNIGNIATDNVDERAKALYEELYNNHIKKLEKQRKRTRNRLIITIPFTIICVLLALLIRATPLAIIILIPVGIITFLLISRTAEAREEYANEYKKDIVSKFINIYNPNLLYNKTDKDKIEKYYKDSKFDFCLYNTININDIIEGVIQDDIYIEMADVCTQYIREKDDITNVKIIFEGMFVRVKSNLKIQNNIYVTKNNIPILQDEDIVSLDDSNFENYFDVYCKDRVLAARIFTSEVMQMMADFYNKTGVVYEIVLKEDNIYIRLNTGDIFEPNIFKKAMNRQQIYTYYNILKFIVDLTKKINNVVKDFEQ